MLKFIPTTIFFRNSSNHEECSVAQSGLFLDFVYKCDSTFDHNPTFGFLKTHWDAKRWEAMLTAAVSESFPNENAPADDGYQFCVQSSQNLLGAANFAGDFFLTIGLI